MPPRGRGINSVWAASGAGYKYRPRHWRYIRSRCRHPRCKRGIRLHDPFACLPSTAPCSLPITAFRIRHSFARPPITAHGSLPRTACPLRWSHACVRLPRKRVIRLRVSLACLPITASCSLPITACHLRSPCAGLPTTAHGSLPITAFPRLAVPLLLAVALLAPLVVASTLKTCF